MSERLGDDAAEMRLLVALLAGFAVLALVLAAGLGFGVLASFGLTHFMQGFLFGVGPFDPAATLRSE